MKTNSSPPFLGHVEHVGAVIPRQEQSKKSMSCMLIHGRRGKVVLRPVIRTAPGPDDYYENNRVLSRQLGCFEVIWRFENLGVRRSRYLRISTFERVKTREFEDFDVQKWTNFSIWEFWHLSIGARNKSVKTRNKYIRILEKFVNLSIRRFKNWKMYNEKITKFGKPNVPKFIISFRKLKLLNKLLSREYRTSIRQSKLS